LNKTIGDKRGSINSTGKADNPSAKATGTRKISKRKNPPNNTKAAMPGDKTTELILFFSIS
jgi:hypothetical protein